MSNLQSQSVLSNCQTNMPQNSMSNFQSNVSQSSFVNVQQGMTISQVNFQQGMPQSSMSNFQTNMPSNSMSNYSQSMSQSNFQTSMLSKLTTTQSNMSTANLIPAFNMPRPQVQPLAAASLAILQPQKISQPQQDRQQEDRQSKMFDKEFILELEKNLGLREVTANLMPPSPAPSGVHSRSMLNISPSTSPSIPTLRPPPQVNKPCTNLNMLKDYKSVPAPKWVQKCR